MVHFKHLLCSIAMLVMAYAQSTSLSITINSDSTSEVQTSYTLTGTSIVAATGSPPPVASTTIRIASTAAIPIPTSSSATAKSSTTLSVPVIAGIAAGGGFLLIAAIILITFICVKRHRKPAEKWPELPVETVYRSADRSLSIRRPSSAATLVAGPAQAYIHSKGSMEYAPGTLVHSKSADSSKSSRSTILERVSEEVVNEFEFEFSVSPTVEVTPPPEQVEPGAAQVNKDTWQKLSLDKSLPSSPEHEIPMHVLDLENYQAMAQPEEDGRPRSSVYSTATGQVQQSDKWGGGQVRHSQSYF